MSDSELPVPSTQQLHELLADPEFQRIMKLVTDEIGRSWSVTGSTARRFVLSAIGEPDALRSIHAAWFEARTRGTGLGLAKVIVRRRVIDLLRKDARPAALQALSARDGAADLETTLGTLGPSRPVDPRIRLELLELVRRLRGAIDCFASQGRTQRRQAELLRRYALDEASYAELSAEYACPEPALRVRVFKARRAFSKHIEECHPDLGHLLDP